MLVKNEEKETLPKILKLFETPSTISKTVKWKIPRNKIINPMKMYHINSKNIKK